MPNWRSEQQLPLANGDWQCWRPPLGRRQAGKAAVDAAITRWHPWDPLLIGVPGAERLLPPVCIVGVDNKVQSRALFQYRMLLGLIAILTVAACAAAFITGADLFANAVVSGTLLFLFVLLQYVLIFRPLDVLRENSMFVAWVYMRGGRPAVTAGALMLILGMIQFWLQRRADGLEPLIMEYGLVFDLARQQPWRYLTGPFVHSGIVHWTGNATILVLAVGLGSTFGRKPAIAVVFISGVIIPALLLSILPYSIRLDAFVGISGGALALLGWVAGLAMRKRTWFSPHFSVVIGSFALLFVALSHLLISSSNTFVHVVGLLVGTMFGWMAFGWKRSLGVEG